MKNTNHVARKFSSYLSIITLLLFVERFNLVASIDPTVHVLNGTSGEISSPGYPQRYGKNEKVYYGILGKPGTIAKLSWKEFEVIDYAPECYDAYVMVILG